VPKESRVELKGPIFKDDAGDKIDAAIMDCLKELATQVVADVQHPLKPGHGWVTGRLHGSIGFRMLDGPGFIVESGATSGDPLPYAYWIETGKRGGRQLWSGYGMFKDARTKLNKNMRQLNKLCGKAVAKKLGGGGKF
jgi:hypothetical protein